MKNIILELKRKLVKSIQEKPAEGLLFSGGLDSAILAGINPLIKAITISLESEAEDIHYSKSLARLLNIEHFHKKVDVDEAINAIPKVIKTLKTFDPAIPNDLVVYFGLSLAKKLGLNRVATGDGSDELFAGYSFMQDMDNLEVYIRRITEKMYFSSNKLGGLFNIEIIQPFITKSIINFALQIPVGLKIKEHNGRLCGKWILRRAFEGVLPEDIAWQSKRPLEYGSGMTKLRQIISDKISDEEFRERPSSVSFISKEHFYYYRIYTDVIGEIPKPKQGQKKCSACGTGIKMSAFHCKVCGHVFDLKGKGGVAMKKARCNKKKDIIAHRKKCKAKGTGLSHYVLLDKKS